MRPWTSSPRPRPPTASRRPWPTDRRARRAVSVAPPGATPAPGTIACPRCATLIGPDQDWCLDCGAPARTRLAPTPNWRVPVAVLAVVVAARRRRARGRLRRAHEQHRARGPGQLAGTVAVRDGRAARGPRPAGADAGRAGPARADHAAPQGTTTSAPGTAPARAARLRRRRGRRVRERRRGAAERRRRQPAQPATTPTSGQRAASRAAACGGERMQRHGRAVRRRGRRRAPRASPPSTRPARRGRSRPRARRRPARRARRPAPRIAARPSPRNAVVGRRTQLGQRVVAVRVEAGGDQRSAPARYARASGHDDVLDQRQPRRRRPTRPAPGRLTV